MDNFGYHGQTESHRTGFIGASGGSHQMESNERYYRRRAAQELAAAKRAMTEAAALRRRQLAESYLKRLAELTGVDEMRMLEQEYA